MSENRGQNNGSQGQSSTGMAPNVAGALSYVLGIITGVLFFALEKNDKFVRFHAMQSIILSVAWIAVWIALSIVMTILGFVPILNILAALIGILISVVLGLGGLVLWIFLIVKAFQGERFSLPYIGEMAEKYANQQ